MYDDIDINGTAALLMKRYGEDASSEASTRADELLDKGDDDGWFVWMRIVAAIKQLEAKEPDRAGH